MEVKIYTGTRLASGGKRGICQVMVNESPLFDTTGTLEKAGIGFEWGFSHGTLGKKSLNLAKSILASCYGTIEIRDALVNEFAEQVVYKLAPEKNWSFDDEQIRAWANRVFRGISNSAFEAEEEDEEDEEDELDDDEAVEDGEPEDKKSNVEINTPNDSSVDAEKTKPNKNLSNFTTFKNAYRDGMIYDTNSQL